MTTRDYQPPSLAGTASRYPEDRMRTRRLFTIPLIDFPVDIRVGTLGDALEDIRDYVGLVLGLIAAIAAAVACVVAWGGWGLLALILIGSAFGLICWLASLIGKRASPADSKTAGSSGKGGSMFNWIWPTKRRGESTILVRLGRVLHWITAGVVFLVVAAVAMALIVAPETDKGDALVMTLAAFGVLMAGRALRYILAGE